LEEQVAELESESSRLSQSLEMQKTVAAEAAAAAAKKYDEVARELQIKVCYKLPGVLGQSYILE
jgi:hypothetical protein